MDDPEDLARDGRHFGVSSSMSGSVWHDRSYVYVNWQNLTLSFTREDFAEFHHLVISVDTDRIRREMEGVPGAAKR